MEQLTMIDRIRKQGLLDADVEAILMYGSFTQGCGDAYSDIEFYVFVRNDAFAALDRAKWVAAIHPVERLFFNEFGTEVAIFANLIRGEFHFLPAGEMDIVSSFAEAGYFPDVAAMCLVDKDGRLAEVLQKLEGITIDRHTKAEIEQTADMLMNNLLYGSNVFLRGEYARALEVLSMAQRGYLQLVRLNEGGTHHWVNPSKALEKEISEAAYAAYGACTATLQPEAICNAYTCLIEQSAEHLRRLRRDHNIFNYQSLLERIAARLPQDGNDAETQKGDLHE